MFLIPTMAMAGGCMRLRLDRQKPIKLKTNNPMERLLREACRRTKLG